MRARLERIMERYGQTVTLIPRGGEALETRAFLQLILRERTDPPVAVTPLGPVSEQRWLYIGRAGVNVSVGDRMSFGEVRLVVQEARPVYWQDETLYQRAVLRLEKEAAV
ncbi:MAG: hypothetical protein K2N78_00120 [Oscillospiraceae bacterium]|nr:hypothetical protein [Oscillospiraceae bacterium]